MILKELLKSGLFDITVLTRQANDRFPSDVKVVEVDYGSLESLVTALAGQDAVVSALSSGAIFSEHLLIDAAAKSHVKRIIPSQYGCNLHNSKIRQLPVFAQKVDIEEKLIDLAKSGCTSYTLLFNGPLLDWGLENGTFFDFKNKKVELYDGGEVVISTTLLSSVGKAVRRILTHPRETADRAVWIKDIDITQKQLLALAQTLTPGENWEVQEVDTAELERVSLEAMQQDLKTPSTMLGFLRRGIFGEGYNGRFEKVHNQIFGIKGITEADLKELFVSIFANGLE